MCDECSRSSPATRLAQLRSSGWMGARSIGSSSGTGGPREAERFEGGRARWRWRRPSTGAIRERAEQSLSGGRRRRSTPRATPTFSLELPTICDRRSGSCCTFSKRWSPSSATECHRRPSNALQARGSRCSPAGGVRRPVCRSSPISNPVDSEIAAQRSDFRDIVRRAVDAILSTEPRSEVTISYEPPDREFLVAGEPRLLSRAVAELVSNAVIHARRHVCVSIELVGKEVAVSVEDDGAGVSDAARATLFRRFIVRTTRGGLGIGLSIAQDLSRLHGGKVVVGESSLPPGRPNTVGARFVLFLPLEASSFRV